MKISFDKSALHDAMKSIGAVAANLGKIRRTRKSEGAFNFGPNAINSTEFVFKGKDVDLLQSQSGLLAVRGEQVTLHIFQPTFVDEETLSNFPASGPKVHFTECKTIERMRRSGKFDKYVKATRKDGLFSVQPLVSRSRTQSTETMEAKLLPCQNCLAALNYEGWLALGESRQQQVLNNFSFQELHENFRIHLQMPAPLHDRHIPQRKLPT